MYTAIPAQPHVMSTYGRVPMTVSHGQGCYLWDVHGRRYLDALGGIAVNTLGHAHPALVAALCEQVGKLIHCSNYYYVPEQQELAAMLVQLSGLCNVFFCNSGLEANEAALKLARKFGHSRGIAQAQIVVFDNAFHGRSIATLSATGNAKIHAGFEPLVPGFIRVPRNDMQALRAATDNNPHVVAVLVEPIQGEGGIQPLTVDFLRDLRTLCDERNWLLMLDEIQTGIGRTGRWFAHQWAGIQPDVMTLAKGLGSGVPVGAVVAGERAAYIFQPGNHGTTFGGNPLAMRAGIETLRIMQQQGLLDNASQVGAYLKQALQDALADVPGVVEVRGQGLMLGIELDRPCGALLQTGLEHGLLFSVTADRVIRLVPPLILSRTQADEIVRILVPIIQTFLS